MDDGSLQNKGLHLNTYGFTNQGVLNLKSALENMFGVNTLKCSIHKHKKGERIYIWEESMDLLRHNISQFMHKNMLYLLPSVSWRGPRLLLYPGYYPDIIIRLIKKNSFFLISGFRPTFCLVIYDYRQEQR